MRDYPIGSFLFWHVERKNVGKYQFYEFVRDFHERNSRHNPKANVTGKDDITAILDGQQRLTSLFIGLKGSYAYKEPRKRWDNPQAFPKRYMYLNLLSPKKNRDETDMIYDFAFLTNSEAKENDDNTFWFKVSDVLNFSELSEVMNYLIENGLMDTSNKKVKLFVSKTLHKLWSIIHESCVINYFLEKDDKLDKVLNIFIRINSGGTILSYSDLLLSIATAQWQHRDAREEITSFVDEINCIGDGFNFDKDLILKGSLVLADIRDISFKVDNFNRTNMLKIEQEWDAITSAFRGAVTLVSAFGYSRDSLTANYAIIPIAYYLKSKALPKNFDIVTKYSGDRKVIHTWLIYALVKRVFGGVPDSVIRPMRDILRDKPSNFPLNPIIDKFKGTNKSLNITEDDIENMLCYQYGQGYTFSTLALLYPSFDFRNRFHIDHIHPRSHFTKVRLRKRGITEDDYEFYMESVDMLPNLQLLEGISNQEKSDTDFEEWMNKYCVSNKLKSEFMRRHFIPDTSLSLIDFREFFEQRKVKLKHELCRILGIAKKK